MNKIRSVLPLLLAMIAGVLAVPWSGTAVAAAVNPFACDATDSPDKGWTLPVYVYQPGQNTFDADSAALLNAIWETDQTFDSSAKRFGISRRIRFVQDGNCRPVVAMLPFVKGRNRAEMSKALGENLASQPEQVRKLWPTNRVKPLFMVRDNDITDACTGGGSDAGLSNGGAILPRWCWGGAGISHEMIHSFGLSHCDQSGKGPNGNDPVCRGYGTKPECTTDLASIYHLDSCRIDDFRYFEPTPLPGKQPLAKNRNVAFSPYLIQNQPSPVWAIRIKVKEGGKCFEPSGQQVVLHACSDAKSQIWQRGIDGDGYVTYRNAPTGLCLQMTDKVTTAKCVDKDPSQQWLSWGEQEESNIQNRGTKGGRLSVDKTDDGAPAVKDRNGRLITDLLGADAATPAPTQTPKPTTTPTSSPTAVPTPTATTESGTKPTPEPNARIFKLRSTSNTCLTAARARAYLGSCRGTWRIVPVAGDVVQLRHNGRCLALGKVSQSRRSTVLTTCRVTAKGQRWLLESQPDGTVTVKSATTKATRLVPGRVAGKAARFVYAKAAYAKQSLRFTIK